MTDIPVGEDTKTVTGNALEAQNSVNLVGRSTVQGVITYDRVVGASDSPSDG